MTGPAAADTPLDRFVQQSRQLESLPAVALRILELTAQPGVSLEEIRHCVERDPGLASRLLRLVNSAFFGRGTPVSDLTQAIARLGTQRTRLLVLGFSLPNLATAGKHPAAVERFWRHALIQSVACRILAEAVGKLPADELLVAGLLQHLGQLVLINSLGDAYVRFLQGAWAGRLEPRDLEPEILGFEHVQLSARLMATWHFPDSLISAISAPRTPAALEGLPPPTRTAAQVIQLADRLALCLIDRHPQHLQELQAAARRDLEWEPERLQEWSAQVERQVPDLAAALAIPWKQETEYLQLLLDTQQLQAETIQEVVAQITGKQERCYPSGLPRTVAATREPIRHASAAARPAPADPVEFPPRPRLTRPEGAGTNLPGVLAEVLKSSRQMRAPVSLALVQIDQERQRSTPTPHGTSTHQRMDGLVEIVRQAFLDEPQVSLFALSVARLGVILPGRDRPEGLRLCRELLHQVRGNRPALAESEELISVSIGLASLALPAKNFPASELIQAAERCLDGVLLSGGDGVKSIDVL